MKLIISRNLRTLVSILILMFLVNILVYIVGRGDSLRENISLKRENILLKEKLRESKVIINDLSADSVYNHLLYDYMH